MKKIAMLFFMSLVMSACDSGDDLTEIFMNKTWKLSFFTEGGTLTDAKDGYNIQFYENTFAATTPTGAEIVGYWEADNESRDFRCSQVRVSKGNISNDATATKMEQILRNATSYSGDANVLIISQNTTTYMQFHNR